MEMEKSSRQRGPTAWRREAMGPISRKAGLGQHGEAGSANERTWTGAEGEVTERAQVGAAHASDSASYDGVNSPSLSVPE